MKQVMLTLVFILAFCLLATGQECPKYSVSGPPGLTRLGGLAVFELKGDEDFKQSKLSYFWTISGGTIYAGQDTKILIVSSDNSVGSNVTATVAIEGLPANCEKSLSETTGFEGEPKAEKFDEYGIGETSVKARIDNFFIALQNDPNASGVIAVRSKTKENLVKAIQLQLRAMFFLKKDLTRVIFKIISDQNAETIEYWMVPKGASFPPIEKSLTVSASEYGEVEKFFTKSPRRNRR